MKKYAKSFETLNDALKTLSKNDLVLISFYDDLRYDLLNSLYRVNDLRDFFSKELFIRPVYALYKQYGGYYEIILK